MAPPPNPNLPLQERLLALAKTLQCTWYLEMRLCAQTLYGIALLTWCFSQSVGLLGTSCHELYICPALPRCDEMATIAVLDLRLPSLELTSPLNSQICD
jgi:hypothetical protein